VSNVARTAANRVGITRFDTPEWVRPHCK